MIRKLFCYGCNTFFKQQIRRIGIREINVKNPEKEKQLPIFQYPISKETDRRIYVWGYLETGALGLGLTETNKRNETVTAPTRLSFGEKYDVTNVVCGYGFTIFAVKSSDQNKVFGTGLNTDSQIGIQKNSILIYPSPILLPLQCEEIVDILSLSAGRAHLLILTTKGLFTLGNNSYGQCGRPVVENEKYLGNSIIHHIPNIHGQKIINIQSGQDHSLLLTDQGEVFGCGWGADGQTGLGHYRNESQFTQLGGDIKGENIIKLSCIADCVLALNDKGDVFGWGNSEYGQLLSNSDYQQVNTPIVLKQCKNIGKVVDIVAGGSFCMVLNSEGSVFVWGYGLLGVGPEVQQSYKPLQIPPILFGNNDFQPDTKVTSICGGMSHMATVTNVGDLYMWGKNRHGCLGLGHKNDQYFPLKVCVGAAVEKISCGLDHSVAICKPFI